MRIRPARAGVLLIASLLSAPAALIGAPTAGASSPTTKPKATTTSSSETPLVTGIAAPSPLSVGALTAKLTAARTHVVDVEQSITGIEQQIVVAQANVDDVASHLTADQREASVLVAAARRQVIASYERGSAAEPYALAAALTQGNVNDAAWSLGVLRLTSKRTADLAKEAEKRSGQADRALTQAIAARDQLVSSKAAAVASLADAHLAVDRAADALKGFVSTMGPATIDGMTTVAYDAYRRAATTIAKEDRTCGLRWELLSAIGRTESHHGAGRLDAQGTTTPPILGPPTGPDTDQGLVDTDPTLDHAVGPMQFIPSTWKKWGVDGNGDGVIDANNIFDETLAAGHYLCAAAGALTLTTRDGVIKAILAYNPNEEYLQVVGARYEALAADVAAGWFSTGDLPTVTGAGGTPSRPPKPVDPPAPVPARTEVRPLSAFSATAPTVPLVGGDPAPATCDQPSVLVAARVGALRCALTPAPGEPAAEPLDPCLVAPYDLTLLACLRGPDQPARLVRVAAALAPPPTTTVPPTTVRPAPTTTAPVAPPPPPYYALVLTGGDQCIALPPTPVKTSAVRASAAGAQVSSSSSSSTSSPTTSDPTTSSPTTSEATTTSSSSTTTTTTHPPTTPPTTAPATTAPPTTAPASTLPPTTTSTLPPVPGQPPAAYRCASGAEVLGQPTTAAPLWTAMVNQEGIAPRLVDVLIAYV